MQADTYKSIKMKIFAAIAAMLLLLAVLLHTQIRIVLPLGGVLLLLSYLFLRQVRALDAANRAIDSDRQEKAGVAAEWQDTFDAIEDAVWLLDRDRRVIRANRACMAIFGRNPADLIGSTCCDIICHGNIDNEECPFRRMLESGRRAKVQLRKENRWYEVSLDPVFDPKGRIIRAVHVVKEITDLKRAELREHLRSEILERISRREALGDLLTFIATSIEEERPGALCSILLVSADGKRLLNGAAPSLPPDYNAAVNGTRIGEGIGSCGTAAFRRERVVVEDIASHPFWKDFAPAGVAGLRSCWSEPIFSSKGELLGTFAIYHREPATPGDGETGLIEQASAFAGIAIELSKGEQERKDLVEQLHQSQKMEAIGHLAGGAAHDFNNLLTPIIIYADMIRSAIPQDNEKLHAKLDGIMKASQKARDLTQQLLGFGRKQIMEMKAVDLNEVVTGFYSMLHRTLRENIELTLKLAEAPLFLQGDRSKLEQVILNLAINAQDAIADTGAIVMETGEFRADGEYVRQHPGMADGRYLVLTVSDTGCGMPPETIQHIFEPFFTTKSSGQGTGLGLANVYGIVKQHNGHIEVQSAPGLGTTFRILLPATDGNTDREALRHHVVVEDRRICSGTVLLVEDNAMVREMTAELLTGFGYVVHAAAGPHEALETVRRLAGAVDLILTDVVMPVMNGRQLFRQINDEYPDLTRVLYMSGYTDSLAADGFAVEDAAFLAKPFTVDALITKIRAVMGQI